MFYTADWLSDKAVRMCGLAARGAWFDLLCLMDKDDDYEITGSILDFSRVLGCSYDEARGVLLELIDKGVCDVEGDVAGAHVTGSPAIVTLISRRLKREYMKRHGNRLRKRKQRAEQKLSQDSHTPSSCTSSIAASCSLADQEEDSSAETSETDASAPPPSPAAYVFPEHLMRGTVKGPWMLTEDFHAVLHQAYPEMNLLGQYAKMQAWLEANPGNRKTHRGMTRFIRGWVERAQNQGAAGGSRRTGPTDSRRPSTRRLDCQDDPEYAAQFEGLEERALQRLRERAAAEAGGAAEPGGGSDA